MKNHHEFVMCEVAFRITGLSARRPSAGLEKSVKFPEPTWKRGDGEPQSEVRPLSRSRSDYQPKQGCECPLMAINAPIEAAETWSVVTPIPGVKAEPEISEVDWWMP